MPKSVIAKAESIEDAIELGLKELSVPRSQVKITVLTKPKKPFFGKSSLAEVKLEIKEESKSKSALVWIENGKLKYSPPEQGGKNAIIIFSEPIKVKYNGVECQNRIELDEGIAPLSIELPPDLEPRVELDVEVSSDQLEAYLAIKPFNGINYKLNNRKPTAVLEISLDKRVVLPPKLTSDQILEKAKEAGIVSGINYANFKNEFEPREEKILLARGKAPRLAKDGFIEFLFDADQKKELDDDEPIDFYELKPILNVVPDQILARKVMGIAGENGINVYGDLIQVAKPKEASFKIGDGVRLDEEGMVAYADRAGMPLVANGVLKVLKVFELNSDASLETGNIRFNGEVIIRGNVSDQVTIRAIDGGVNVYGMVDQAKIVADHNIIITKNVIGSEIKAGGVTAAYNHLILYLNDLILLLNQLLKSFIIIVSRVEDAAPGALIKNLLEIKFTEIPRMIMEFDQKFSSIDATFSSDFRTLVLRLKAMFLDRGPLKIKDIREIEVMIEGLEYWQQQYATASDQTANIEVSYLQNCKIEASGTVRVNGKGVYYSNIVAAKGYKQPRGVFRSSQITVNSGIIEIKELGAPSGVRSSAQITREGKIICDMVYPNVVVGFQKHKYQFIQAAKNVKVLWDEYGIVVYSGREKLS